MKPRSTLNTSLLSPNRAVLGAIALGTVLWSHSAAPGAAIASDYRIGIEDRLHVAVWGEPAINLSLQVRSDGKITLPLANELSVVGLTPEEVREQIGLRLAGFFRDPKVTVIVEESNSFRVFVIGEVGKQGPVNFYRPTRLLEALSTVGGLTPYARGRVSVIRNLGGAQRRLRFDYKTLLSEDGTSSNIELIPGDTIVVD